MAPLENTNTSGHTGLVLRVCNCFEAGIKRLLYGMMVMEYVDGVRRSKLGAQVRRAKVLEEKKRKLP